MNAITVVVPTLGRPTLIDTLESVAPQLLPQDRVVVVLEHGVRWVDTAVTKFYKSTVGGTRWMYMTEPGGCWGHPNRNMVMDTVVDTSHVWTLDDDVATDTALPALRCYFDAPWAIFRMHFGDGHFAKGLTLWRQKLIRIGDVGTPMIFAPLTNARFGLEYAGDLVYARQLQEQLGDPVWAEDVVAIIRPKDPDANLVPAA